MTLSLNTLPLSKRAINQLNSDAWAEAKKQARKVTGGAKSAELPPREFRGAAKQLQETTASEVIISGPYECIAGETKIFNPVDETERSVEWYFENEIPPTVLTRFGAAQAEIPFIKGYTALYRVTLENGLSFVATSKHRVLTSGGWMPISAIASLPLVTCVPSPQLSSWEPSLLAHWLGVLNFSSKALGCQDGYSFCSCQCGEQPHLEEDSVLAYLPSRGDALGHIHADQHWGDRGFLQECTHPYLSPSRLSIAHSFPLAYFSKRGHEEYYVSEYTPSPVFDLCQPLRLSQLDTPPHSTSYAIEHRFSHKQLFSSFGLSPLPNYTILASTVKSVEYERDDFYYDLHVPVYGHYLAEGVFHHNTGKTMSALYKLHNLLTKYPGSQALMVRKTNKSLLGSVVVTWEKKVHGNKIGKPGYSITKYGGEKPEWYDYDNGSRLVLGGMDNPDKFLSAEFDFVYANQAEELQLDDWEKLTGRATGRAGNSPYPQVFGDCNPGNQYHWIKQRARIQLLESRHKDNPALYTSDGELTEQGARTMEILNALTGVRQKRGRDGLWVASEGQVYDFDPEIHLIDADKLPEFKSRYRVIDFGYTNPFVCQWWGEDYDGRLYLYREIYHTKRTINEHLPQITKYSLGESYVDTISDHDAEDRATLEKGTVIPKEKEEAWMVGKLAQDGNGNYVIPGIKTTAAKKEITPGIEAVRERLKVQPDKKPRLYLVRDCLVEVDQSLAERFKPTCTEKEFPGYIYPVVKGDKAEKEDPTKVDDHGMDTTRYLCKYLDKPKKESRIY